MVYTFRMVSDEVDDFMREVRIDADATFLDLRAIVCNAAAFPDKADGVQSFFICDDGWEKGREVTLFDMGFDPDKEADLMEETHLRDLLDEEGQRLIFTFDYLSDRSLFMELKLTEPGKRLETPEITRSRGTAPQATSELPDLDDLKATLSAAKQGNTQGGDDDDDFLGGDDFGADGYNDEDFEGLEEMDERY